MLFRRKPRLKQQYDEKLLQLIEKERKEWETAKQLDRIMAEESEFANIQRKLAEKKYFYLFKEARIRGVKARF